MSQIIIDIETRPNEKLGEMYLERVPKTPEGQNIFSGMATDTDYAEIVCVGIKQIGGKAVVLDSLKQLETPIWDNYLRQATLVSFNGKKFDFPIIVKQGLKQGIKLPYDRLVAACKPWGYGERHVDLIETLAFGGRWKSLDDYLRIYLGIEKKTKGEDFFEKATIEEIKQHCLDDLNYTEELFNFFLPLYETC